MLRQKTLSAGDFVRRSPFSASWAGWLLAVFACALPQSPLVTAQESGSSWTTPVVNPTTPYNFHVVLSESFLNRFVARDEVEPGVVNDFVFGAKVDGTQTISRQLRLDLLSSPEMAAARFLLSGQIDSMTVGRTEQGAVQSISRQEFLASKDVFFNGREFSTRHAEVRVRASNQPIAASTQLDGTFLARLGQKIAISRADQQRPETEAYAREKVVERVYPAFDGNVDNQLGEANGKLRNVLFAKLQQYNIEPAAQRVSSTDSHLHYAIRWDAPRSPAPFGIPSTPLAGSHGLSIYLHESLFNGLVDRFQLQGKRTTTSELRSIQQSIRRALGTAAGQPAEERPAFALPDMSSMIDTDIEFDPVEPLSFEFQADRLLVRIRATFKPAGQPLLPPLQIDIPWQLVDRCSSWEVTRGALEIRSTTAQPLPEVARNVIRQSVEGNLPAAEFPKELPIPNWPENQPALRLTEVRSADGWIGVSLD